MKILFLTHYYAPDTTSNCIIATELAQQLVKLNHDVTVVTSFPHYDNNEVNKDYRLKLVKRSVEAGVNILRTWVYVAPNKKGLRGRFLGYLSYNFLSSLFSLGLKRHDVVLASSPPLTIGLTAWALSRLWRAPYVYNVQDIFPQVAVELGALKQRHLIRFFEWMEQFVYAKAARVSVLSEGFKKNLLDKGVSDEKIVVVPNFVDTNFVSPRNKDNPWSRALGWHDKFVVMYAGNVGRSQNLDLALDAADLLQDQKNILFAIVGNGAEKDSLIDKVRSRHLTNVTFLPFQPRVEMPDMYAAADTMLVTLRRGICNLSVPSKTYSIMASGRPILACVEKENDVFQHIIDSGGGLHVEPDSPEQLADAIKRLVQNPKEKEEIGRKGREYVERGFSAERIAKTYDSLFASIVDR